MSKVTDALIKELADAINTQSPQQKETRLIGTVIGLHKPEGDTDNTRKYYKVQLDGSEELTPALAACACEIGDRVTVGISNHSATITGNLSSALFIKSANAYIQLIDDGLIIGKVSEDGTRTGGYIKVKNDTIEFYSSGDEMLATYSADSIIFGDGDWPLAEFGTDYIDLLEGNASIEVLRNDGHYVLTLEGMDATGLRAADDYGNKSEVISWADGFVAAALQVTVAGIKSSLMVTGTGVTFNGSELITVDDLFYKGQIKITGNIRSGYSRLFSATAAVPDGYKLSAIREVAPYTVSASGSLGTSHNLQIMNFRSDPDTNTISARIYNASGSTIKTRVVLEWLALKAENIEVAPDQDIDLPDE